MIYLKLFLTFLEIGAVSFGGGYGMISLIRERCIGMGWLSQEELLNMIAVAESTPGPIAVNMATFVGSAQGGAVGALLATLGIVLPSFLIILLVSTVLSRLFKLAGVKAVLGGIKPAMVALIIGTALTMLISLLVGVKAVGDSVRFDFMGLVTLALIAGASLLYKVIRKKPIPPIPLIAFSAVLGILLY